MDVENNISEQESKGDNSNSQESNRESEFDGDNSNSQELMKDLLDSKSGDSNDSEAGYDTDSEDEEYGEIDNLLEVGLDIDQLKRGVKRKVDEVPEHEEKERIILVKPKQDHFDFLPEGWIEIIHFSGMPLYLHKKSRVCTLAKPYYLGTGSARKHGIPFSAVPCLHYRKSQEPTTAKNEVVDNQDKNVEDVNSKENASDEATSEGKVSEETTSEELKDDNPGKSEKANEVEVKSDDKSDANNEMKDITKLAKVETFEQNRKQKTITPDDFRDYCARLFEFKKVTTRKFKTWADRRKHAQLRRQTERPTLPESTKLITCKVEKVPVNNGMGTKINKKEFVMNPTGKSSVCILHEFIQHTGRTQPKYVFQELENVSKPYCATVIINDAEHGKGFGASKKEAKAEAARATLEILIPDLKLESSKESDLADELSFFNNIGIEDHRVTELCQKSGQYSPYQILVECLRRHHGISDVDIKTEVKLLKHQKNEYMMRVGEHEAKVICKNKREGKQRAAQAILQKLHPYLQNWGGLLKLYGRGTYKTAKEKREAAQEITELQNLASHNSPNYAILNKLKEEMLKLRNVDKRNFATNSCPINHIQLKASQEYSGEDTQTMED